MGFSLPTYNYNDPAALKANNPGLYNAMRFSQVNAGHQGAAMRAKIEDYEAMTAQGWKLAASPAAVPAGAQTYAKMSVGIPSLNAGAKDGQASRITYGGSPSVLQNWYKDAPAPAPVAAAAPAAAAFVMPEQSATAPSVNAAKPTDYTIPEKDHGPGELDKYNANQDTAYNQWKAGQGTGGSSGGSTSDKDWTKYYSQQYGDMSKPLANAPTKQADWGGINRKAGGGDFLTSLNNYTAKVPGTSTFA